MKPQSILPVVKGMMRDYAVDSLPDGYVWDMRDFIPQRRGTRMESRSAWQYMTPALPGPPWAGCYGRYQAGEKFLMAAGGALVDVNPASGASASVGTGFTKLVQNGVMLRNRIYFMDGNGAEVPKVVNYDGTTVTVASIDASAPHAKVGIAFKDRLVLGAGADVYFSPIEADGGPTSAWDPVAKISLPREAMGFGLTGAKLLVFHPGRVSRISGQIPPGNLVDTDMYVDTLTDQVGCTVPHTIVPWNENVCFADERGIYLTDGASVRNLTEQGGISDFWRDIYASRDQANPSVCSGVYFDYLIVSVRGTGGVHFTLICDLNTRGWFRFSNHLVQCMVPSEGNFEELYGGRWDTSRMIRISDMFTGTTLATPDALEERALTTSDMVDGDGTPVLASVETGWQRLGEEGLKQLKQVFVSYRHQSYDTPNASGAVEVLWRKDPAATTDILPYASLGTLPGVSEYTRKRLPIGGKWYGAQIRIAAKLPCRFFNVSDIGIAGAGNDRGRVTR